MNAATFKQAQEAYTSGDYKTALEGFSACAQDTDSLSPADLSKFYHLIGNCYVKGGDPYAASTFYQRALSGSPEKRKPSLYVNLGTALLGSKDYENALVAFSRALTYPIYNTPYKAYSGIGAAQLKLGNMTEAGAAYREAALDPTNPAPAKALVNLGVCFMELGRSTDAITSYETALEFDLDDKARAKAEANLGQAYMAEGRVQKAIDAFESAMSSGDYQLSPMASHDYEIAMSLKDRLDARVPGILDTGFIPNLSTMMIDKVNEPSASDFAEPDEDGFDPFAPKTHAMEPVSEDEVVEEETSFEVEDEQEEAVEAEDEAGFVATPVPATPVAEDELEATLEELGLVDSEPAGDEDLSAAATQMMRPVEVEGEADEYSDEESEQFSDDEYQYEGEGSGGAGYYDDYEEGFSDEGEYEDEYNQYDEYASSAELDASRPMGLVDSGEPLYDVERTDTHMPNPDQTGFFDVSENQIEENARVSRKKARKSRGVGLKVAIVVVILAILVVGAGCAAYMLGYGYPSQEDVTRNFFSAVQNNESTDKYWAKDVEASSRESQTAILSNMTSYSVEGVDRSASQTAVYVKGTLREGGQIEYKTVLARDDISWAIEYVELYFPSAQ